MKNIICTMKAIIIPKPQMPEITAKMTFSEQTSFITPATNTDTIINNIRIAAIINHIRLCPPFLSCSGNLRYGFRLLFPNIAPSNIAKPIRNIHPISISICCITPFKDDFNILFYLSCPLLFIL